MEKETSERGDDNCSVVLQRREYTQEERIFSGETVAERFLILK